MNRKNKAVPIVWIFPPSSPLHQMLFLPLFSKNSKRNPNNNNNSVDTILAHPGHYIPSNELYLEGLENIWMRMSRGGLYSRGVLILTTHRLIFIQYPSYNNMNNNNNSNNNNINNEKQNIISGEASNSFLVTIPHCLTFGVSLRRRWKKRFHTLGLLCKNQVGYLFACSLEMDEFVTLRAFRRIKTKIQLRQNEDLFSNRVDITTEGKQLFKSIDSEYQNELSTIKSKSSKSTSTTSTSSSLQKNHFRIPLNQKSLDEKSQRIQKSFNLSEEYTRMGIDKFPQWRKADINQNYQLCSSYPSELIVPTLISDDHLKLAASQRSSNRLPVLSWIHPITGASLCR